LRILLASRDSPTKGFSDQPRDVTFPYTENLMDFALGFFLGVLSTLVYFKGFKTPKTEISPGQVWELPGGIHYRILREAFFSDWACEVAGSSEQGLIGLSSKQIRSGRLINQTSKEDEAA